MTTLYHGFRNRRKRPNLAAWSVAVAVMFLAAFWRP